MSVPPCHPTRRCGSLQRSCSTAFDVGARARRGKGGLPSTEGELGPVHTRTWDDTRGEASWICGRNENLEFLR